MKIHQAGYPFVVALMGCSMSEEQERLLVAMSALALLMLDGDQAGRKGTEELLAKLGRCIWVKALQVQEGRQPDQMKTEEIQAILKR